MSGTDLILNVLSFLMLLVLAWFGFTTVNIIVTIFRTRKQDKTLQFSFSRGGKIFFIVSSVVFLALFIGGIIAIVYGLTHDNISMYRVAINLMGLGSLLYSLLLSNTIQLGRKDLMIGRMLIDYRKMKKVTFSLDDRVTFVYAQKEYTFTTRFADLTEIKKAMKR